MGLDYSAYVVYGVPETKEMVQQRVVTKFITINACPNHPPRVRTTSVKGPYCAKCGGKNTGIKVSRKINLSLTEAYATEEDKKKNDWLHEEDNFIIETNGPCGGDVYFGIILANMDIERSDGAEVIRSVSDAEEAELIAFLDRIGYENIDLKTYLVPAVW